MGEMIFVNLPEDHVFHENDERNEGDNEQDSEEDLLIRLFYFHKFLRFCRLRVGLSKIDHDTVVRLTRMPTYA